MRIKLFIVLIFSVALYSCSTPEPSVPKDDQCRVVKKTDKATGQVSEWEYDSQGRLRTIKSPEGTVKHFYDVMGRLIRVEKLPDDIVWEFEYTDNGKLKTIKDPAGNISMYVYDKDGKLIEKILPDGTRELDPKPPAGAMAIVHPDKPEEDKPAKHEMIRYKSSVNTYTIPGKYK